MRMYVIIRFVKTYVILIHATVRKTEEHMFYITKRNNLLIRKNITCKMKVTDDQISVSNTVTIDVVGK